MPVEAITFDFWCTLFGDKEENSARRRQHRIDVFVETTGATPEQAAAAHDYMGKCFHQHHVEKMMTLGPTEGVEIMCTHCGVCVDEEQRVMLENCFADILLEHPPEPLPGALEAVQAAAQHLPVGIISDSGLSPGRTLKKLLDRHGFTPYIQFAAFSDEVGVAKPQAPIFEAAARELCVGPHCLLHLGDLEPTDVAGALAMNARAALFTGYHDKYAKETKAHHIIPTWQDFIRDLDDMLKR